MRMLNKVSIISIMSAALFITGCGEDTDDGGNSNGTSNLTVTIDGSTSTFKCNTDLNRGALHYVECRVEPNMILVIAANESGSPVGLLRVGLIDSLTSSTFDSRMGVSYGCTSDYISTVATSNPCLDNNQVEYDAGTRTISANNVILGFGYNSGGLTAANQRTISFSVDASIVPSY